MNHREVAKVGEMPVRTLVQPERFYEAIDGGIRFPLKVLHAAGLETCQSCQGGEDHSYDRPTIDMIWAGHNGAGFIAADALAAHGLRVQDVSIVWRIEHAVPVEAVWRVTLWEPAPDRADDWPMFAHCYHYLETPPLGVE